LEAKEMPENAEKFAGLEDAMVLDDGEKVAFTIKDSSGKLGLSSI
jgi:hypothetical protein